MAENILEISNLSKTFRSHWIYRPIRAVESVSLEVKRGESFGFLGSNGAGKTTTIKCIVGLIKISSGTILFNGEKLKTAEQRSRLGFLPEQPYFYEHLSVQETVDFFASLQGITGSKKRSKVLSTLERVGLSHKLKSNVRELSKGLQQRLGFAQAIINDPELLLLDEPFSGLDPIGRKEMRTLINQLNKDGTTIFMSSHILPDVEDICDRVSIMKNGSLKQSFNIAEIPELFGEKYEIILDENSISIQNQLKELSISTSLKKRSAKEVSSYEFESYDKAASALEIINKNNLQIYSFQSIKPNLEEIFMQVTSDE